MTHRSYRFCLSAILVWIVSVGAKYALVMPDNVVSMASFLPPMLGLMWGPIAAMGCFVGSLLASSELESIAVSGGAIDLLSFLSRYIWVLMAGLMPCFLWHSWRITGDKESFPFRDGALGKLLLILVLTFLSTSIVRLITAEGAELEAVLGLFGTGKAMNSAVFVLVCFANDFLLAVFFDVIWLFVLVCRGYAFYQPKSALKGGYVIGGSHSEHTRRTWNVALIFYMAFPIAAFYLDNWQIYGMDNLETWMRFMLECIAMMDAVLVLMAYLLLHYRRSIMLEVVFLVTMAVFMSSTVLGLGCSWAMWGLVNAHVNDNLEAMSVICRERLDRTFFCTRQAVDGMALQAVNVIDSYDRLANDEAYRDRYCESMKERFSAIAMSTDGCIAFYVRLAPEIAGPMGGFSMQREDVRWEGALSPFVSRPPIDLSKYLPEDVKNVGWYYIPIKNHSATWIEPYVDPTAKSYVISYVAPIRVEGKYVGVVGMDIDFAFIMQELRRLSIYDYGYVYITNRNGIVLYHRDLPQGYLFHPNPEYKEMEIYLTNGMWLGIATPLSKVHDERNRVMMHLGAAILMVAMFVSLISILLASRAIRPLAGMTEAAKRIASGDLNVELSYESGNELGILVRSIREMASKLEGYVYRDKLTGLRNTAAYMSKGAELDERGKTDDGLRYGVIIFDANFLKKVNDQYGHESGNELIRHASKVICKVFAHSPVYRIGGDEFAAILEGQDYERRERLLMRFDEEAAAECFEVEGGNLLNVSVARGLGVYEPGMDFAAVAKLADAAMYEHKSVIKEALGEDVR